MNKFSQAYQAAQSFIQAVATADSALDKTLMMRVKTLLAQNDGPAVAEATVLDQLRCEIATVATSEKSNNKEIAQANALIKMTPPTRNNNDGVATLKWLKHLYCVKRCGAQSIWVYSPPKAYMKWIYDEVNMVSVRQLENILAMPEDEIFSSHHKEVMCDALQQALSIALATVAKLGTPSETTKAVVKQYFSDSLTTEATLLSTMATLRKGFQRIADVCNSAKVIISDEPIQRNSPNWRNWAFIYTMEEMNVIYIQNAWLNKADEVSPSNQSPLYRCTRTILHELSHKAVGTEDIGYGPKGLSPNQSATLTAEFALHNADSWAYFAMEVMGLLTGPDLANGKKPNSAILKLPTRTLRCM
jgi:Lysine-specific metallo-endopeptidase